MYRARQGVTIQVSENGNLNVFGFQTLEAFQIVYAIPRIRTTYPFYIRKISTDLSEN